MGSFSHISAALSRRHRDPARGPKSATGGRTRPAARIRYLLSPYRFSRIGCRSVCAGEFPRIHQPKNSPAAQNEPWESPLPEAYPPMQILHPFAGSVQQYLEQLADPDHIGPLIVRSARPNVRLPRTASTPARSSTPLSTARFACAALMPSLPAHRLAAARVRTSLPTFQHSRHRLISRCATPGSPDPRRHHCPYRRPTSAANCGCAVSARKPQRCAPRWPL